MRKTTIQVVLLEFIGPGQIVSFCEVMGLLRSRETYLRVTRKVTAECGCATAGGTYQEEVGKSVGFGLIQNFTWHM